ncbi:ROK family transcriptional regulator [Glaciihabitans sp. dw_435]|uniref:ROK family transcriptional regulator n=1 Tax=Glaciihabitans sp. dw_435 TaxID=2720081 RepID=UPI001BD48EB9|nr:ROK family transcriptional regulator [Glaciihabitans sp. dw_435]
MPVRARPRNPGSQTALRQSNQQRIVQSLLSGGPSTQAELSRETGLSTATISNIVKVLGERGIVTTSPTTSSGRRALSVSLSGNGAVTVGVDFGRTHVRIVVSTLDYRVVAEEAISLPQGHRAELGMGTAASLLDGMLLRTGISRSAVLGVGVGIPGPIDHRTSTVVEGAILPEWVGVTLGDLESLFDFPVYIDNDADLGALAEVTWGPHNGVSNLVFVKIGSGIGGGMIINGQPYSGNIGVTGEIGHTPIVDHGLVCRCGNRGCLETVASTAILVDRLSSRETGRLTIEDVIRQARDGDAATIRVLEDAALAVGRSLANIANLVNPEVIVIGGPLTILDEVLLDPIRRGMVRYTLPRVGETTELVVSSLGERAEALGAAALVLRQPALLAAF